MVQTQQGFPQLSAPISDVKTGGRITQPWLQFFITLWNRTGGQTGTVQFSPGDIKAIGGNTVPGGWLLCDGSAVSRAEFGGLFSAIGTIWGGGDGSTTFNVPNLISRAPIGAGGSIALGARGGNSTITLDIAHLPSHSHAVIDPGHTHTITDPGHVHASVVASSNVTAGGAAGGVAAGNTTSATTGITVNTASTGILLQNTGSGQPISTISPYAAVNWIIKT